MSSHVSSYISKYINSYVSSYISNYVNKNMKISHYINKLWMKKCMHEHIEPII